MIAERNLKVSLIISTYNWPQALELCLLSARDQTLLPDEILIADDGSRQETLQLISSFKNNLTIPLIHVWHEDKGFRKAIALNNAVKKSSGDYIVQIDGDVILDAHFIQDHIASAEEQVFLRGTRALLSPDKTKKLIDEKKIELNVFSSGVLNRNNALRSSLLRKAGARKEMSGRSVRGSNLSYWKSDFIKVNGYNNDLTGWGHEDEELATRFINNNIVKKIIKLCAVQYHLHHPIASQNNEPLHRKAVDEVRAGKIKFCINGYNKL